MDGFGVLSNIDYSQFAKKPNFIVVSQLTGENFINKAISLGACYYLVKPLDIATLKDRVKEFGALETVPKNKTPSTTDLYNKQSKSRSILSTKSLQIYLFP